MMIPDAEPIEEQPDKPAEPEPTPEPAPEPTEPTPEPTPVPVPVPEKAKVWVRLKGTEAPPIQVDEDAVKVELPREAFEEVVPEVWENVTRDWYQIVNDGRALDGVDLTRNKPFAFLTPGYRWVWEGDCLAVKRRVQP